MIKTPLCDLLGIDYPIFQGGMAWIADGALAAAVSNGGGLGIVAAGNAPADYVREQIQASRRLTNKPFGVNIMLMSPFVEEVARMAAEEKVAVITTGAGNPDRYLEMWHNAGSKVIPVIASTALAKRLSRMGVTALIAEGGESGGHVGETTTMALVPQVMDVTSLPVIAAGGIADGRGFAAAMMLGACGVQMGTRFLVAKECSVHRGYKDKILKATDISTIVTGKRLGHPVRSIKTPFSRSYYKGEYEGMSEGELNELAAGALQRAAQNGDVEKGCFLAGQIAGMVTREQPAAEILQEVMQQAEEVLRGAGKLLETRR